MRFFITKRSKEIEDKISNLVEDNQKVLANPKFDAIQDMRAFKRMHTSYLHYNQSFFSHVKSFIPGTSENNNRNYCAELLDNIEKKFLKL